MRGLKKNVIVGRLIPAGTGMQVYRDVFLEKQEPLPPMIEEEFVREEEEEALTLSDLDEEQ